MKTMTTLIGIKTKDGIFMASDLQTTSGNMRMVDPSEKILTIGGCLISTCGSVGMCQQMIKQAIREIMIGQVLSNSNIHLDIDQAELAGTLADLNFRYPLEYKTFHPFGFLVAGVDRHTGEPVLSTIGDDGSNIPISTYHAEGSGAQVAIGKLDTLYRYDMDSTEAIQMLKKIIQECGKRDVYTAGVSIKSLELQPDGYYHPIVYDLNPQVNQRKKSVKSSDKKIKKKGAR